MRRVADHCLVEVADLDLDMAYGIGHGPEVAEVAITADPDRRALGQGGLLVAGQPLVELGRVATHISMGRARHLEAAGPCRLAGTGLVRRGAMSNPRTRHG